MDTLSEFLQALPNYAGIFLLMLSTFLLGYFSASQLLRTKYRKIINRLKREVNVLKTPPTKNIRDIDTIFTEIEPKLIKIVKEQQEILEESKAEERLRNTASFAEKNKETYLAETKQSTEETYEDDELDFDSFGYADADDKENLTEINGIGPYIEQKLNNIGIYTYAQISNLSQRDIELITEMIDFFPGRIERDNWVGQAKSLKVY
jgi:predicted flap endonuclease-1-like 5' DNA nuclease